MGQLWDNCYKFVWYNFAVAVENIDQDTDEDDLHVCSYSFREVDTLLHHYIHGFFYMCF